MARRKTIQDFQDTFRTEVFVQKQRKIDVEKVVTVTDFIFLGSKITLDGDCSHKIKRCLDLGRKAMTNLDSILKSRDITCQQSSI